MSLSESLAAVAAAAAAQQQQQHQQHSSSSDSTSKHRRSGATLPQVFKATYSGVAVFEFICRGVAVMRRRDDSFLNATQILKVADFDKPQRTRILEREVQTGEHEKVQGGYGKYQGTWVPFVRGIQLARQYKVEQDLRPLFEFSPSSVKSPPLAPKHVTVTSGRARKTYHSNNEEDGPMTVRRRLRPIKQKNMGSPSSTTSDCGKSRNTPVSDDSDDESMLSDVDMSSNSSSSSDVDVDDEDDDDDDRDDDRDEDEDDSSSRSESESQIDPLIGPPKKRTRIVRQAAAAAAAATAAGNKNYADSLLNHFISDSYHVPKLLVHSPPGLDVNLVIDDEGHTSLHWAAAMAKIKILKTLLKLGADVVRGNDAGQTALIRSVMFSNNHENCTFPEILDILSNSIFTPDRERRTVLHHIMLTAGCRGKVHAAKYYMECLVDVINRSRERFSSLVNMVDVNGDTALGIAAKIANKRLVKLLLDVGGDPTIKNHAGKSADDYAVHMEVGDAWQPCDAGVDLNVDDDYESNSGSSPAGFTAVHYHVGRDVPPGGDASSVQMGELSRASSNATVNMAFQALGSGASCRVVPVLQRYFEQINSKYESEKKAAETEIKEASELLISIQKDVSESKRVVEALEAQTSGFSETQKRIQSLENQLCQQVYRNQVVILRSLVAYYEAHRAPTAPPLERRISAADDDDAVSSESSTADHHQPTSSRKESRLTEACGLRERLANLKGDRQNLVRKVLALRSQSNLKQAGYHKLIATCCNIKIESVDGLLRPLLDALGTDQTFAS